MMLEDIDCLFSCLVDLGLASGPEASWLPIPGYELAERYGLEWDEGLWVD